MDLRPYQKRIVANAADALRTKGKALIVAATGAGKTVILSALGRELGGRQLVLQHRNELVEQNSGMFGRWNPGRTIGYWTANRRNFGDTTFAMVQSLVGHTEEMPKLDMIIADEAHHIVAPTWRKIIDAAYEQNPDLKLLGVTATPARADGHGLKSLFGEVCDKETTGDLVRLGYLVRPIGYVEDVSGVREKLEGIGEQSDFGDQADVETILNTEVVNAEVVRKWRQYAADRLTVVFASTVKHAKAVADAFNTEGVGARCISGEMNAVERQEVYDDLAHGRIKVVTNCMVLTEGWDFPPVSCVILLRKCSHKSPMIQMVGRGLRTVSEEKYPGIVKKDCVVIDFGLSIQSAGDLTADLDIGERAKGDGPTKQCPNCNSLVALNARTCKFCGYIFPPAEKVCPECGWTCLADLDECPNCGHSFIETRDDVHLTEYDLLGSSQWQYCLLFNNRRVLLASGFEGWAGIFTMDYNTWYTIAQKKKCRVKKLFVGEKAQALRVADDFMNNNEEEGTAGKTFRWLQQPMSDAQRQKLREKNDLGEYTKYEASCRLRIYWNLNAINDIVLGARQ